MNIWMCFRTSTCEGVGCFFFFLCIGCCCDVRIFVCALSKQRQCVRWKVQLCTLVLWGDCPAKATLSALCSFGFFFGYFFSCLTCLFGQNYLLLLHVSISIHTLMWEVSLQMIQRMGKGHLQEEEKILVALSFFFPFFSVLRSGKLGWVQEVFHRALVRHVRIHIVRVLYFMERLERKKESRKKH